MPGFNSKHYGEVRFYNESRSAEKTGGDDSVLVSAEPLRPGEVWTLKVEEMYDAGWGAELGVTGCDPASLTSIPDESNVLPQSRVLKRSALYTDGTETGECPRLRLSPGDTYGVSWAPGHVTFYRNGSVHYGWEVDTPNTPHIWGVVEMFRLKRISVVDTDIYCVPASVQHSDDCRDVNEVRLNEGCSNRFMFMETSDRTSFPCLPPGTIISDIITIRSKSQDEMESTRGSIRFTHKSMQSSIDGYAEANMWKYKNKNWTKQECMDKGDTSARSSAATFRQDSREANVVEIIFNEILHCETPISYVVTNLPIPQMIATSPVAMMISSTVVPGLSIDIEENTFIQAGNLEIQALQSEFILYKEEETFSHITSVSPIVSLNSTQYGRQDSIVTLPMFRNINKSKAHSDARQVSTLVSVSLYQWKPSGKVISIDDKGIAHIKMRVKCDKVSFMVIETNDSDISQDELANTAAKIEKEIHSYQAKLIVRQHRDNLENAVIKIATQQTYQKDLSSLEKSGYTAGPQIEGFIDLNLQENQKIAFSFHHQSSINFLRNEQKFITFNCLSGSCLLNCAIQATPSGLQEKRKLLVGEMMVDVEKMSPAEADQCGIQLIITIPKEQDYVSKKLQTEEEHKFLRKCVLQIKNMADVKTKWQMIAMQLDLTIDDLADLHVSNKLLEERFVLMTEIWMQADGSSATRKKLIQALVAEKMNKAAETVSGSY